MGRDGLGFCEMGTTQSMVSMEINGSCQRRTTHLTHLMIASFECYSRCSFWYTQASCHSSVVNWLFAIFIAKSDFSNATVATDKFSTKNSEGPRAIS